jgi:hypothetical protein
MLHFLSSKKNKKQNKTKNTINQRLEMACHSKVFPQIEDGDCRLDSYILPFLSQVNDGNELLVVNRLVVLII